MSGKQLRWFEQVQQRKISMPIRKSDKIIVDGERRLQANGVNLNGSN